MNEFVQSSVFFGVFLTISAYCIGLYIRQKTGKTLFNPILLAVAMIIALLHLLGIEYESYKLSASPLSSLLTPATICLAVPLYEQLDLLKKHKKAVLVGIASGVATSLVCVLVLCLLFRLDHATYVTLLPKSITTAIGMDVSRQLGGYVSITVAVILITGIFGNMIAGRVCRLFSITEPIAKGVGIGTAAHAIGTTRAMEMGKVEGAMSSLSIVVSGILTVVGASLFAIFL